MELESIAALAPAEALGATAPVQAAVAPGFGEMVSHGLERLNGQLVESQTSMQQLAVGDAQNLHQMMIGLEETRISFQLMLQIRSRLLEAYQDVMKMQV